jgi:hypothetical protein
MQKREIRHNFHSLFWQPWLKKTLDISYTRVNYFLELVYRRKCEILYYFQFLTQLWQCGSTATFTRPPGCLIWALTPVHAPRSDCNSQTIASRWYESQRHRGRYTNSQDNLSFITYHQDTPCYAVSFHLPLPLQQHLTPVKGWPLTLLV